MVSRDGLLVDHVCRLIFMTYNGWVMIAVSLGAFFGYLAFGHSTPATKDNACH